jgi:methyl-accepting chemotaxis protein WspA
MFGRSNLKIRILFGYSLPILCLVGLGAIVYSSAKDTFERQAAIRTSQITINGINEMTFGLGTMVRNARGYILFPEDKTSLQSYKSGIEFFRGGYTEIDQKVDNSQIREQLALYLTDYNQKKQAAEEIFRLVDGGKIAEAKRLLRSVNMIEAEARRKNIIEQQVVILAQKDKEGADAQRLLIQLVFGGTALSTLFIIIVGVWVSNEIAAPLGAQINQLVKTAEQISVGDLTAPVIISAQDSQEIKKLLAAFQQ